MRGLICTLIFFALSVTPVSAGFDYPKLPSEGATVGDLVPEGWKLMVEANGDLDKDGRDDVAAIIEWTEAVRHERNCGKKGYDSHAAPRILLIALAGDDGYRLAESDSGVVLRSDEGGVWGDPFQSLEIARGTVVLSHYAGSAWRWGMVQRFRFQNGGWYLIGHTESSHHTVSEQTSEYDYNLSTGKVAITATGAEGGPGCRRCLKGEACPRRGCSTAQTRATKKVTWKQVPRESLPKLGGISCTEILPFVPYD